MSNMVCWENLPPGAHGLLPEAADRFEIVPLATTSAMLPHHSVIIRPFRRGDAAPMYEAARESMDQLCAWMTWCRPSYSISDAETFVAQSAQSWEQGEQYSFAIVDAENGAFLGSVGLSCLNSAHQLGNVGY